MRTSLNQPRRRWAQTQPTGRRPVRWVHVTALVLAGALATVACSTSIDVTTEAPPVPTADANQPTAAPADPTATPKAAEASATSAPTAAPTNEPATTDCPADVDEVQAAPAAAPAPAGLIIEIEEAPWDTNVMAPTPPGGDAVVEAWKSLADQCSDQWACTLLMPTTLHQRGLELRGEAAYIDGEGFTAAFAHNEQTATLRIAPLSATTSTTDDTTVYRDGSTMRSNATAATFHVPGEPCRYSVTFDQLDPTAVSSLLESIHRISGTNPPGAPDVEAPDLIAPSGPTGPVSDFCTPAEQLPLNVTLDAHFEAGDERQLNVSWGSTFTGKSASDVILIVEAVTSEGWVLVWREFEPLVLVDEIAAELDLIDEVFPGYSETAREALGSLDIRYELDAFGIVTVLNDAEVVAHVDAFLDLLDRLVDIDPFYSQNDADETRASWGDDEDKVFAMTEGLFVYHTAHGWLLSRDQLTEFDDSYPSGIDGSPFPSTWKIGIAAAVDGDGCLRYEQVATSDPAETRQILNELYERDGTGTPLGEDDAYVSEDRTVVQLDYTTGLPRSVHFKSIYKEGDLEEDRFLLIVDVTGAG